jgi:hypothetical protein
MGAAALREQFDSFLGGPLDWRARPLPETVPSGIAEIDLPRGGLVEIVGPASSGRTSLLLSILAAAGARQEACALVDAEDAFDPGSAAAAGVRLEGLLWVRCGHNAEHALKAADLLIQGGGFGLAILDLGDTPPETARRISLASWFRLRRAVEHTPAVLVAVARHSLSGACASLVLECGRDCTAWSGAAASGPPASRLLRGLRARATSTHGSRTCSPVFTAAAL